MTNTDSGEAVPITIKKYANRRLYNTATSSYVTLDHLSQMVKDGVDFLVFDAKTGEDITRAVLTQIIVEEENKGIHLLPISFMRQLISLYGDNLQWMVPNYLDYSMQVFSRNQDQIRQYFQDTMSGMFNFNAFEEVSKQNMAMFERAIRIFSPFGDHAGPGPDSPRLPPDVRAESLSRVNQEALEALQRRLDELQHQIEEMAKVKSKP